MKPLYNMIATLEQWVDEIPPVQQPMRFGNKAFRSWLDKVHQVRPKNAKLMHHYRILMNYSLLSADKKALSWQFLRSRSTSRSPLAPTSAWTTAQATS